VFSDRFKVPSAAYNGDAAQHTTKKKALSLGSKNEARSIPVEKSVTEENTELPDTGDASHWYQGRLILKFLWHLGVLKVGGYYDTALLPDYCPELFDLDKDKLVQHNIIDEEDKIVPCWSLYDRLRPGTLLLCKVTLHGWNIGIREGKFKRVGHIVI
jgi:hypothetical protein